jgi:hypothetical protein
MRLSFRAFNIAVAMLAGAVGLWLALRSQFDTPTSAVQSLWTTAGVFGAILTSYNLRDAFKDKKALIESGRNGEMLVLAKHAIFSESLRLSKMLIVAFIGFYSLQAQPVLTKAQRAQLHIPEWTISNVLITAGLMWIVLGTVITAYMDRRVRSRIYSGELIHEPHDINDF